MGTNNEVCSSCKTEWLGRCFGKEHYGKDVSVNNSICSEYVDGRRPVQITDDAKK